MKTYTLEQIEDETIPCTSFDMMLPNVVYYWYNENENGWLKDCWDETETAFEPSRITKYYIKNSQIRLEAFTEQTLREDNWEEIDNMPYTFLFKKGDYRIRMKKSIDNNIWSIVIHFVYDWDGSFDDMDLLLKETEIPTPAHFYLLKTMLNIE
jgi:hypothetical protein